MGWLGGKSLSQESNNGGSGRWPAYSATVGGCPVPVDQVGGSLPLDAHTGGCPAPGAHVDGGQPPLDTMGGSLPPNPLMGGG